MMFRRDKYYSLVQICDVCGKPYFGLPVNKFTPERDRICDICLKEGKKVEKKDSVGL